MNTYCYVTFRYKNRSHVSGAFVCSADQVDNLLKEKNAITSTYSSATAPRIFEFQIPKNPLILGENHGGKPTPFFTERDCIAESKVIYKDGMPIIAVDEDANKIELVLFLGSRDRLFIGKVSEIVGTVFNETVSSGGYSSKDPDAERDVTFNKERIIRTTSYGGICELLIPVSI